MDTSLDTALQSVRQTLEFLETDTAFDDEHPLATQNGVSLLSLKNHALISYLQNAALVLLSQIERSTTAENDEHMAEIEEVRNNAIRNTITQRIVLEKGLKGLESKISYQVEKSLRAYAKSKALEAAKQDANKGSDDVDGDEEDEDEETGDLLMFKPNPKLLLGSKTADKPEKSEKERSSRHNAIDSEDDSDDNKPASKAEKYQPPKISATSQFGSSSGKKSQHKHKNALMEDYLEATSVAPVAEPSIGSTIIGHGRGVISARDRRKEKEINEYEETNYTRLSSIQRKQQEKEQKRRRGTNSDSFFGEDWGFSAKSNVDNATSRSKNSSVWDRAKKRRHR